MKRFPVRRHTYSGFLGPVEKQPEKRDIGFVCSRPFIGQLVPEGVLQYDALWLLFRREIKPGTIEGMIMEENRPLSDHFAELLAEARTQWEETQRVTVRVIVALVGALDLMRERRKPPVFALNLVMGA